MNSFDELHIRPTVGEWKKDVERKKLQLRFKYLSLLLWDFVHVFRCPFEGAKKKN